MELVKNKDGVDRDLVISGAAENPFRTLRELGIRPGLHQFLRMFWNEVAETGFKDNWQDRKSVV